MFTWAQVKVLRKWGNERMWCVQEFLLCPSLTMQVALKGSPSLNHWFLQRWEMSQQDLVESTACRVFLVVIKDSVHLRNVKKEEDQILWKLFLCLEVFLGLAAPATCAAVL